MQAQEMLHAACKRAALMSWISVSLRFWPALLTLSKMTFIFRPYCCELERMVLFTVIWKTVGGKISTAQYRNQI